MITVYFLSQDIDRNDRLDIQMMWPSLDIHAMIERQWVSGGYDKIATLATDDLDDAWEQTQSIWEMWCFEPPVVEIHHPVDPHGFRSSMVGDIFQIGDEFHVVDRVGFRQLSLKEN